MILCLVFIFAPVCQDIVAAADEPSAPVSTFPAAVAPAVGKLKVMATVFPVYELAREVGGERIEVKLLMPPGVEPHEFDPSPADLAAIDGSDIFIYAGGGLEPWVARLLPALTSEKLLVMEAGRDLPLVEGDPHFWLDPALDKTVVDQIARELGDRDEEGRAYYAQRAQAIKQRLDELDARLAAGLKSCRSRTFIYGGHSAFGYFARRYGLKQVSPYAGFSPNAEPSARAVAELVDKVRALDARVVYFEELVEPRAARVIATETGVKLELLNGAHNISRDELERGVTFWMILDDDLRKLREGLQCR